MARVLVTGASGFVAPHLIRRLIRDGHDVLAVGRDGSGFPPLEVERVVWDMSASATPPSVVFDAVIHLAQANVVSQDYADYQAVNVDATRLLAQLARRVGAQHFVLASSGSVYGAGDRPWHEDDVPLARDAYAASKLEAERIVLAEEGLVPIVLRLFAPYGPGLRGRLIADLLARVRAGRPIVIRAGGRPRMNPIFVEHVAEVFAQSISKPQALVCNVAGHEVLSIREMGVLIGDTIGCEPVFKDSSDEADGDFVGDTARLREEFDLSWPLTSFRDGIAALAGDG